MNESNSARARETKVARDHRHCYVSNCDAAAVARVRWRFNTGYESEHDYCRSHLDAITDRIASNLPAGVSTVEVVGR